MASMTTQDGYDWPNGQHDEQCWNAQAWVDERGAIHIPSGGHLEVWFPAAQVLNRPGVRPLPEAYGRAMEALGEER